MKNTGIKNYYDEYLEVCRSVSPASGLLELRKLLKKENPRKSIVLPFGTGLVDYSNQECAYISEHCTEILSYTKEEYIEGGLGFHLQTMHPADRAIFGEQVFHDISLFWGKIPTKEIENYRFSVSYRYLRKDGTLSQMHQHSNYLEPDSDGKPLINLLTFSDIGDIKTDSNLVLTISRLVAGEGYVKVFSKTYLQADSKTTLSKRELEILRLSAKGQTSKMIAENLFIDPQTVKNHKRNMMAKTSVRNIAGFISMGILNNWI